MKNAHFILSHITYQPQFRFLKKQSCYQKFIHLLPPKFQKAIAFVYIENSTLFVALSHPGYKMELNYNQDLLKSLLTMVGKYAPECVQMKATKVIIFNAKHQAKDQDKVIDTDPKYSELSNANFEIKTKDSEIMEKFQKIKETIRNNLGGV
jgi:hypothetical protein